VLGERGGGTKAQPQKRSCTQIGGKGLGLAESSELLGAGMRKEKARLLIEGRTRHAVEIKRTFRLEGNEK